MERSLNERCSSIAERHRSKMRRQARMKEQKLKLERERHANMV